MKSDVETASAADCMVQALAGLLGQAGWSKMSKNTLQGLRRRDAEMLGCETSMIPLMKT